jgi:hypothetical protein
MRNLMDLVDKSFEKFGQRKRWKARLWRDWMYGLPMWLRVRLWNLAFDTKLTIVTRR